MRGKFLGANVLKLNCLFQFSEVIWVFYASVLYIQLKTDVWLPSWHFQIPSFLKHQGNLSLLNYEIITIHLIFVLVFFVFFFLCFVFALYFALDEWGFFSCRLATALIVSPCFSWQAIGLLHKNMQSCMLYHNQDSFWNLILGAASHHASQQGYSHAEKDASIKGILESIVGFCIVNGYPPFRGSIF